MKQYKAEDQVMASGTIIVQCNDLVGTGRNWSEPSKILGISIADFVILIKDKYNAKLTPHRKDGKVSWIGYSWDNLKDARAFKNDLNRVARTKKYMI